jgi:16S rRNA (adenine1518-N6/adenine1519-N6)-dimethyltransferase
MKQFPIQARKSLGQHFLADDNIARNIAAALRAGEKDTVLEIGAGTGSLTKALQQRFAHVVAMDIDRRSVQALGETIEREGWTNVSCRYGDVLDFDLRAFSAECGGKVYLAGNLPYNITSRILFHVFDNHDCVREAVFMMQREVAERLIAAPRTKEYGILSVMTRFYADVERVMKVSPNVFVPKPAVWSAVVRLVLHDGYLAKTDDPAFLNRVVRTAFNQRRKILSNSLASLIPAGAGWPGSIASFSHKRPEELSVEDFILLAGVLHG